MPLSPPSLLHELAHSGLETADGYILVDAFQQQQASEDMLDGMASNGAQTDGSTSGKTLGPPAAFFWSTMHNSSTTTLIEDDDDAFTSTTDMSSSWLGSIHSADQSPYCRPEAGDDDVVPMELSEGSDSEQEEEEEEEEGEDSSAGSLSNSTLISADGDGDATPVRSSKSGVADSLMPPPPPPPPLFLNQRRNQNLKRTREPSANSIVFPESPVTSATSTASSSPATALTATISSAGGSPGNGNNPDLTAALSGLTVADSPGLLMLPPKPEPSQKKQQHAPKRRASSTALQALSAPHAAPTATRRASTSIPSQGTPSRVIFSHHNYQRSGSDVAISNYNNLKRTEPLTTAAKKCDFCGATSTPMWRHGPIPFFVLCNSCGVKWKRGKILQDMPPASLAGGAHTDDEGGQRGRPVSRRRSRVTSVTVKDSGQPQQRRRRSSASAPANRATHHMSRRNSVPTTPTTLSLSDAAAAKKDLLTSHLRNANDEQLATFVDAICGGVPGLDTELAVAGEIEVDIGRLDDDVWKRVCEVLCKREEDGR